MENEKDRVIDMTLTGEFATPATPPIGARLMLWAIVGTLLAFALLMVVVALWFLAMILPLIAGLVVVAYLAHRYRLWRLNQGMRWRGPGGWNR
jgi:hypothetical protein